MHRPLLFSQKNLNCEEFKLYALNILHKNRWLYHPLEGTSNGDPGAVRYQENV